VKAPLYVETFFKDLRNNGLLRSSVNLNCVPHLSLAVHATVVLETFASKVSQNLGDFTQVLKDLAEVEDY